MINFEPWLNLPLIWGGLIAVAIFMYVMLDGFDLGIGILFPFAPNAEARSKMMNSIAPFWDGNETWLVLGGGGLFAAFPLAYSIIMPAFYMPITLMLISLVFRGVAFEFRFKADPGKRAKWNFVFHFGSLFAAFFQGVILGGYLQGIKVQDNTFAGGGFDWLSGFSVTTGIALVFGYMLLGACWLILKTTDELQAWAQKSASYALTYVLFFMAVVSIWIPFIDERIFTRWFYGNNFLFLLPLPIITIITSILLIRSIKNNDEVKPFILSILIFFLNYIGIAISVWPWMIPYSLLIEDAAAIPESLSFLLIGAVLILPVILFYTGYLYYVFRGKASSEPMY